MTTFIGKNAIGGTAIAIPANLKVATKYTVASGLTISGIQAYMDGLGSGSGVSNVLLGIYNDYGTGITPDDLLAYVSLTVADGAAAGWYGNTLTPVAIPAGIMYFAFLSDNPRCRLYSDTGTFGDEKYIADTFSDGFADPFGGYSNDASNHCIRAYDSLVTLDACLPDADIVTTGWTTAPLFSKVNDSSDATVIQATAS
jgi:hypothetical protein